MAAEAETEAEVRWYCSSMASRWDTWRVVVRLLYLAMWCMVAIAAAFLPRPMRNFGDS